MVLELLLIEGLLRKHFTKSGLATRDVELLREMTDSTVSVSLAFNDDRVRRLFEAKTIDTEVRIETLRQLRSAEIKTGASICPITPYTTDCDAIGRCARPHADTIWIYGRSVNERASRGWDNVQGILDTHFPDLTPLSRCNAVGYRKAAHSKHETEGEQHDGEEARDRCIDAPEAFPADGPYADLLANERSSVQAPR